MIELSNNLVLDFLVYTWFYIIPDFIDPPSGPAAFGVLALIGDRSYLLFRSSSALRG